MKKAVGYVVLLCSLVAAADQIPQELQKIPIVPDAVTTMYERKAVVYDSYSTSNVQAEIVGAKRVADSFGGVAMYGGAQVITDKELEQRRYKSVTDVLSYYGIQRYNMTGGVNDWTASWHGFSAGSEVVVLVDGIKANETDDNVVYWSTIPVSDIERIEIIPGASSQFGSGAFAGVVNIITKQKPHNEIAIRSGSYGFGQQRLAMGVERGDYTFQISGQHTAESGWREKSNYDENQIDATMGWKIADGKLVAKILSTDSNNGYADTLTDEELHENPAWAVQNDRRFISSSKYQLNYTGILSDDWSYALEGAQRKRSVRYFSRSRGGIEGNLTKNDSRENSDTSLVQLNYKNMLTIGYDYRVAQMLTEEWGGTGYDAFWMPYLLDMNTKTVSMTGDKSEAAPFIQTFLKNDYGYLRLGAREDAVRYSFSDSVNSSGMMYKNFSKRSHSGELGMNLTEYTTAYFSYGQAFRAPTFSQLFGSYGYPGNTDLLPERATTYEFGMNHLFDKSKIHWAAFRTLVDDEIVYTSMNDNASKTRRDGYTIDGSSQLTTVFSVRGVYTYTKARILEYQTGAKDFEGYSVPQAPEHTYQLGCVYSPDKLTVAIDHVFVGAQYVNSDFYNEMPMLRPYQYTDVHTTYAVTTDWSVFADVYNVFNNRYCDYALKDFFSNAMYYIPGEPRKGSLGMSYRF